MQTTRKREPVRIEPHVRWLIRRDMPEVLDIENKSFPYPWTEAEFLRVMKERSVIGMVAEKPKSDAIIGYMIYELCKTRLRILNFAVDPLYRRKAVGSAMVEKLKTKLSHQRRLYLDVLVHERNMGALMFWKSQGFVAISVKRGHYEHCDDDAIVMRHSLPGWEG